MFEFTVHVATMASLYALLALSLNLQVGFAGLVNFGQIALFGCGTYGAAIAFAQGWNAVSGLALGLAAAALIGLGFARLGRNLGSDYWGIATLSLAEIFRIFINNEDWLTGGAQGVSGVPLLFSHLPRMHGQLAMLGLCVVLLVAACILCGRLTTSRFGLGLRLMREEPQLAIALGYDLAILKRTTMVFGGAIAAVSGFLFAHYATFVGPDQLVSSETFLIWAMVMVGGVGNNLGVVLGAFLLQFMLAFVPFLKDIVGLPSELVASLRLALVGGSLLAFLLWRTQGLIPEKIGGARG